MPEHPAPLILLLLLMLTLGGCARLPPDTIEPDPARRQPVATELLVNSLQCGEDIREPGVYWVSDNEALNQRYDWLNQSNPGNRLSPPAVDFATERVLVVAMGQRPTSGYLLNFPDQPPLSDGRRLDVTVAWQEPEPDTVQAQVVVNPCLLLRLPTPAAERVRVLDREGRVRIGADG